MSTDDRSPEEKETALLATFLISKRADGTLAPLDAAAAGQLLGKIDSYATGQGAFNLLVPQTALQHAGLAREGWEKAAKLTTLNDGSAAYDLDYMTSVDLLGRLEFTSGITWADARALHEKFTGEGQTRNIA